MKYYVVNTNRRDNKKDNKPEQDEKQMLEEKIAALYCVGYKEKINLIYEGDVVFLYSTGNGIIAYGIAQGTTQVRNYENSPAKLNKNQEHYIFLKNFVKLDSPLKSSEVTKILGQRISFIRAFFEMNGKYAIPILKYLKG